jgi:hypothetical protein
MYQTCEGIAPTKNDSFNHPPTPLWGIISSDGCNEAC